MFKSKFGGYSKQQVQQLIQQIDQDFHTEEEMLKEKIKGLEESCLLLRRSYEEDKAMLKKLQNNDRYTLNTMNGLNKYKM